MKLSEYKSPLIDIQKPKTNKLSRYTYVTQKLSEETPVYSDSSNGVGFLLNRNSRGGKKTRGNEGSKVAGDSLPPVVLPHKNIVFHAGVAFAVSRKN